MISHIEVNDSWNKGEHIIAGVFVWVGVSWEDIGLEGIGKLDNDRVAIIGEVGIGDMDGVELFVGKDWGWVSIVGIILPISLPFVD
jgi:hypothetical protein